MVASSPKAFAKEVHRSLSGLAKTTRARRIYQPGNQVLARMMKDLNASFEQLLNLSPHLSLRVRSDGFYYQDQLVLEVQNPDDSIAYAFYRDGMRRLDFLKGMPFEELEVLVAAIAQGFSFSSFGDDIVSYLWKHDLEFIRYLVVDTTIVNAAELPPPGQGDADGRPLGVNDVDAQIDGLLRQIYGHSNDDVGIASLSLDRSDIAAKSIAKSLEAVDEMAPGFHPSRAFLRFPNYQQELLAELKEEDDNRVSLRAAHAVLDAVRNLPPESMESQRLYQVLLKMYDAAIIEENLRFASYLLDGVSKVPSSPQRTMWIQEALSETRLRQVAANVSAAANPDIIGLATFFKACGKTAVPTILGLIPNFSSPDDRRVLSDLILQIGIDNLAPLRDMVYNEQAYVAAEALYILAQKATNESLDIMRQALTHPRLEVRLSLLEQLTHFPKVIIQQIAGTLINDIEPRVRASAAKALSRVKTPEALACVEGKIQTKDFDEEPQEVKLAFFVSYAVLDPLRATHILARHLKKGEGLLARREAEDTAISAIKALSGIKTNRTIELLKKASVARNKRVREAARGLLERIKKGAKQ